jgi:hypothetical protein
MPLPAVRALQVVLLLLPLLVRPRGVAGLDNGLRVPVRGRESIASPPHAAAAWRLAAADDGGPLPFVAHGLVLLVRFHAEHQRVDAA